MAREKNIDRLHLKIYTLIRFDLITIYEQSKWVVSMFEDCKFQLENKDMNVRKFYIERSYAELCYK